MELLVRWEMPRIAPAISLDPKTRTTLNRWVQAPSTAQALVLRSRIVLAAAAGHANQQIASDLELPQVTVGKWRRSFAAFGLDGLRDAPRSGRRRNTMPRFGGKCRPWPANSRNRGTLDGAHVGAKGGPAAQHGSRDSERIAITTTPHSNLHLQSRPGVRAEIIGHRGVVFEPTGECVGAVYRRKAWDSGARSHAAAVTATCRPTAELDQ